MSKNELVYFPPGTHKPTLVREGHDYTDIFAMHIALAARKAGLYADDTPLGIPELMLLLEKLTNMSVYEISKEADKAEPKQPKEYFSPDRNFDEEVTKIKDLSDYVFTHASIFPEGKSTPIYRPTLFKGDIDALDRIVNVQIGEFNRSLGASRIAIFGQNVILTLYASVLKQTLYIESQLIRPVPQGTNLIISVSSNQLTRKQQDELLNSAYLLLHDMDAIIDLHKQSFRAK